MRLCPQTVSYHPIIVRVVIAAFKVIVHARVVTAEVNPAIIVIIAAVTHVRFAVIAMIAEQTLVPFAEIIVINAVFLICVILATVVRSVVITATLYVPNAMMTR